jgi:hypothetical protein
MTAMRKRSAPMPASASRSATAFGLPGRPFQHLGVPVDRADHVVQLFVKDPRQPQPHGRDLSLIADAIQRRGQVIGQLVPLPLGAQQPFQLGGGPAIGRIDVHRLAQRPMARPRLSSFSSSSFALRRSSASFAAGSTARPASSSISSRSSCHAPQRSSAASNSCATSRSSGRASNSRR